MSLLLTMLPYYLLGNFHCAGMCGPLVLMLSRHRYRQLYFLGRLVSFSLAGLLAGAGGSVINVFLNQYHLSALVSFIFGFAILVIGFTNVFKVSFFNFSFITKATAKAGQSLSLLMLRDQPWPTFLFGFFTLTLPCGQTVVVFSACALYGDPWVGLVNGLCFALLTSPSLAAVMFANHLFQKIKHHYNFIMGMAAIGIGILAICRGLAELALIPHLILNAQASSHYHLVIY
jgi:uncharacterized protein